MLPILNPPPSPYYPSGSSSAPAPSIQYRASNLDWRLVSYMILYMFQFHSPKSSHPLPLPQSPKTVLYINISIVVSHNGEGNGNPLQCSCLENPRDGRAWWAAVYGVAQSRTRLKRLSSSSSIQGYCYHLSKFHIYALVYCIGVFLSLRFLSLDVSNLVMTCLSVVF